MRKTTKTSVEAGGMFAEFEPAPAPVMPTTAPLFDTDDAPVSVAPDYGRAVAPVREAATVGLFETELRIGDDGALIFGIAE